MLFLAGGSLALFLGAHALIFLCYLIRFQRHQIIFRVQLQQVTAAYDALGYLAGALAQHVGQALRRGSAHDGRGGVEATRCGRRSSEPTGRLVEQAAGALLRLHPLRLARQLVLQGCRAVP